MAYKNELEIREAILKANLEINKAKIRATKLQTKLNVFLARQRRGTILQAGKVKQVIKRKMGRPKLPLSQRKYYRVGSQRDEFVDYYVLKYSSPDRSFLGQVANFALNPYNRQGETTSASVTSYKTTKRRLNLHEIQARKDEKDINKQFKAGLITIQERNKSLADIQGRSETSQYAILSSKIKHGKSKNMKRIIREFESQIRKDKKRNPTLTDMLKLNLKYGLGENDIANEMIDYTAAQYEYAATMGTPNPKELLDMLEASGDNRRYRAAQQTIRERIDNMEMAGRELFDKAGIIKAININENRRRKNNKDILRKMKKLK